MAELLTGEPQPLSAYESMMWAKYWQIKAKKEEQAQKGKKK